MQNSWNSAHVRYQQNEAICRETRKWKNFIFILTRTPNKNAAHENQSPFTNPSIQTGTSTNPVAARFSKRLENGWQEDQAVDDSQ